MGVFARIVEGLAAEATERAQSEGPELIRGINSPRTGGPNTKLQSVTDAKGRPLWLFLTADRGQDADRFRDALKDKGIHPCIPGRTSRGKAVRHDRRRSRRRSRIEIMFGRLKDWRRIATRCDRCATTCLSAVALAAMVMFWP